MFDRQSVYWSIIRDETERRTAMTSRSDPVPEFEWLIGVLVWTDLDDLTNDFAPRYRAGI